MTFRHINNISQAVIWSTTHTNPVQYSVLLLSLFSRVRLCATPETATHQAPPSLGCHFLLRLCQNLSLGVFKGLKMELQVAPEVVWAEILGRKIGSLG